MVFSSNELDMLVLQNGEDGIPADSKYIWVKYSQNANGVPLTDDPTGAVYIGIAYNKDSIEESNNPDDYSWSKILGDKGEDAYTIILSNENISFSVSYEDNLAIGDQSFTTDVRVFYGATERDDFVIGEIGSSNGITVSKTVNSVTLSVTDSIKITAKHGYFRIPISIDGLIFYKDMSWNTVPQGVPGSVGQSALNVSLGNESQNIPCNSEGVTLESFLIEIPFAAYEGFNKVACTASVGVLPSGITLGQNTGSTPDADGLIILNVARGSNLGGDEVLQGKVVITFIIGESEVTKNFTWTKTKDGATGEAGQFTLYSLESSAPVISKTFEDTFSPESITFSAYSMEGNSGDKTEYSGMFIIEESINGTTYDTSYLSSADEQSVTFTPTSINVISIRCTLYKAGGITSALDIYTVPVLTDVDNMRPIIDEITTSISGVESKVDSVEKSITNKVWQSDITTQINNYDNTTVKAIRDQVAETKTSLGKIQSTVSDVQTTLTTKADGSTVQTLSEKVSSIEQDANGLKQTVEENYVSNDDLNENNQTLRSEFNQTANQISETVSDLSGNVAQNTQTINTINQTVESFDGKISDIEQTANEIELLVGNKQDIIPSNIRYIRDWLNGNSIDDENRWTEIKVTVNDTNLASGEINIAAGITPTSDISSITNISKYTDGQSDTYASSSQSDWHYLQIDLGENNTFDTGYITVWHFYDDNRKYNHKLEISADGTSWFTLYDSEKYGMYTETNEGKTYFIQNDLLSKEMSFLKLDIDGINAKVQENANNYSSISADVGSIIQRVESVESTTQDLQNTELPEFKEEVRREISEIKTTSENITMTVSQIQNDVTQQAQQIIEAGEWKVSLANIGAYDSSYATQTVNMSLTSNGLTISRSASEGYRTQMTGDTIKIEYDDGRGNFESVMSINRDLMYLTRIKVKNGIDHYTIKEIPIQYNLDGSSVGCLAFISSSGNS